MVVGFATGSADGNPPWLTVISILATIFELLRYRGQYVWWIITDIVSIGMYTAHFDMVYLTKRSIYLIMAVIGLMNWARLNRTRNMENQ